MNRILFYLVFLTLCCSCQEGSRKKVIGVSQCSEDIWRYKQNHELTIGGYASHDVEIRFASADDSDTRQIDQINDFIRQKVDLLIVAPNSAESLSPVIDKAYDSGIPVIYFDRRTNSDKYTAYMGADNYEIGYTMGNLIASDMKGKGTLVEITGLKGSSPAIERHRGFAAALAEYPDIRVVASELGDWTEESGRRAMQDVLKRLDGIDCVFGHNDRLAMGARSVALAHGLNHVKYYGVDALPTPDGGISGVKQGILEATYAYPTQGLELMQLALKILNGERFERDNVLHSSVVDKSNAELLLLQYREQERVSSNLELLHGRLDVYFSQVNLQQKIIVAFIIVLVVIITLVIFSYRFYLAKLMVNEEVTKEITAPNPTTEECGACALEAEAMAPPTGAFLDRFRNILQQNLQDADFNVERIGEEMGMSRVQLYRKVKALTGMAPVELLRKARLSRGKQLLESTDRSVSEIAYDVGFTAPSYFAKCFKDEFGKTPGEVRNG